MTSTSIPGVHGERAIDAPQVRVGLRRERRRARTVFALAVLLFLSFVFAAGAVEGEAEELEGSGLRVDGVVSAYSPERVDVEFIFAGESRRERVQLDDSSPSYEEGQGVVVLVDRDDPDRMTIEGEVNQSDWTVWPMIFAFLVGVFGMISAPWSMLRIRRQRKLLSSHSWRRVSARYLEVPSGNTIRGLLHITENGAEHVVTLVTYARWSLRRFGLRGADGLEIVGELPGYVVIRAIGSTRVASARPPYTNGADRRWRQHFDDPL